MEGERGRETEREREGPPYSENYGGQPPPSNFAALWIHRVCAWVVGRVDPEGAERGTTRIHCLPGTPFAKVNPAALPTWVVDFMRLKCTLFCG